MEITPMVTPSLGRLFQVGLGPYFFPALLVVLVVGALGMLAFGARRLSTDIVGGQACHPRNPVGLESFRS